MARRARVSPATIFFALLSLVLGIALYVKTRPPAPAPVASTPISRPTARPRPAIVPARPSPVPQARAAIPRPHPPRAAPGGHGRIAIVIDDLGNDAAAVRRIAAWPWPVAGAVLPALPGSGPAARELARAGKEVLLHLPMEPAAAGARPGPGLVDRNQSDEQITATLDADLASVPAAVGVNNHMGSAATSDPRVMRAVLSELSRRGLYFLDSRTTDATVGASLARELSVPSVSRRVFLDAAISKEAVSKAFDELVRRAREEGEAVGIGHPHPETLEVLEARLPELAGEGVTMVRVGALVR
ncbi:MAG TPA: divergent polysaccharide deacetylase family protein [Thermoanaerobaculia bacterium]